MKNSGFINLISLEDAFRAQVRSKGRNEKPCAEEVFRRPVEQRRRREQLDGEMVNEDHSAIANLSQTEMQREFRTGMQVERLYNPANED